MPSRRQASEGRILRSDRLLSRLRSERDGADAALHAAVQDAGEGQGDRDRGLRSGILHRFRFRREGPGAAGAARPRNARPRSRNRTTTISRPRCGSIRPSDFGGEYRHGCEFRQQNFGEVPVTRRRAGAIGAPARDWRRRSSCWCSAAGALNGASRRSVRSAALRPPAAGGIIGWILAKQALFYRALSGLIRAAKTDGSAYWGLIGHLVHLWHFPRRRSRPRQGGDLVLSGRQ